jgi:hypothetical protein
MLTEGVTAGVTDIVMVLDVAGLPDTHTRLEVIIQLTTSLLFKPDELKTGLFVPTFEPLIFH